MSQKIENQMARAIEHMIDAALEYSEAYEAQFGDKIGTDYVLGAEIEAVLVAARGLLNGPLGAADGGTMDRRILSVAAHCGFDTADGTSW